MRSILLISAMVAITVAQKAFFEKYSFTKVMENCFGEEYYDRLAAIGIAQRECQQLPVSNLHRVDYPYYSHVRNPVRYGQPVYVQYPVTPQPGHGRPFNVVPQRPQTFPQYHYVKKRHAEEKSAALVKEEKFAALVKEPFFSRSYLLDSVNTLRAALSNYTCTLHKTGSIDENLNVKYQEAFELYENLPLSRGLKEDLIQGLQFCRDLSYCLPLDKVKTPLPVNLQRLLVVMKCERKSRVKACFKEDVRRNIDEFELSLLPKDESHEAKIDTLAAILMGVENVEELQIN